MAKGREFSAPCDWNVQNSEEMRVLQTCIRSCLVKVDSLGL